MKAILERIDSRPWPPGFLERAVGTYLDCGFYHAADPGTRADAASGGVVSALLVHLLQTGQIDGALVVTSQVSGGRVECGFQIATTPEEVLDARGSKYMPVYFRRDALPLIRAFEGRLAAVLLPCDASALARERAIDKVIDERIALVFTLFCGHNSERQLTDAVVDQLRPKGASLVEFRHRFGHWRGMLRARFDDGSELTRPFSDFSTYQNLFFFSQKKCHACFDHFGFHTDLACGDVWSQRMKHDPIKRTAVIARSRRGKELLDDMVSNGVIEGYRVTIEDVCNGQSRALPFHFNVSARSRVGSVFGMRLKDITRTAVGWNDLLAAFIVMLNERVTRSRLGRGIVMRVPRPVLKGYLALLKGLESF